VKAIVSLLSADAPRLVHCASAGERRPRARPSIAAIWSADSSKSNALMFSAIEGYSKISQHALSAEASAQLIAELDTESADSEE